MHFIQQFSVARLSLSRLMVFSVATLLPVLALGGFGLYSIQQDRASVDQTAREEARLTLEQIETRVGTQLTQRFHDAIESDHQTRLRLVQGLSAGRTSVPGPANAPPAGEIGKGQRAGTPAWRIAPPIRVSQAGELVEPRPSSQIPEPPDWVRTLTPAQAGMLASAEVIGADTALTLGPRTAAWTEFLRICPPAARAQAELELLRCPRAEDPQRDREKLASLLTSEGVTASGLPVAALAYLEWLRRPSPSVLSDLPDLSLLIRERPSVLTPLVLRSISQLLADGVATESLLHRIGQGRDVWEMEEASRAFFLSVGSLLKVRNGWRSGETITCVVAGKFGLVVPVLQFEGSVEPPTDSVWLHFFSLSEIDGWCREIEKESSVNLRPFTALRILGEPANPADRRSAAPIEDSKVLARTDVKATAGAAQIPFSLSILLRDTNALYARQRQRAFVLGGMVLVATFTATLGLYVLGRAFRHQLRLAQEQSDFVSSVSHELRAPIAAVSLLTENLARGGVTEPDRQRRYFDLILRECRRLSSLIENVLDLSRIEQGRKRYEFEPTEVDKLAHHTLDMMRLAATQAEVRLELRGDEVFREPVILDGRAIQQALVNLLDNAIKHSPKGATVQLVLSKAGDRALLSVKDCGPGIPPEDRRRIFERFYRRGSELTRQTEGVGLGLAIVSHITQAHEGRVEVTSQPGQGSCFTLDLPLAGPGADHL